MPTQRRKEEERGERAGMARRVGADKRRGKGGIGPTLSTIRKGQKDFERMNGHHMRLASAEASFNRCAKRRCGGTGTKF